MSNIAIAIDGPSGAGKSTLARSLAQEMGYLYVDTGAIYRTVALAALNTGIAPEDEGAVLALLPGLTITMAYAEDGLQHMYLNGQDVTADIRQHPVSQAASQVSAMPGVRDFLLEMQRKLAREHSVVMDGRDIGTVVLPNAQVKIFLTAQPEARAKRRLEELKALGQEVSYEQVLADVKARDARDMNRETAPLKQAEDAALLDTTQFDLDESKAALKQLVKEKLKHE